jgi:hypothetical protein
MKVICLVLSAWVVMALAATAAVAGASEDWAASQKPWSDRAEPGDVVKEHVENVTDGRHAYTVVQGGTVDGRNSRTPLGCGMMREGAVEQTWESNRAVRMENVGETDVINPWLSNGRNDFRSIDEIVASAVRPGMTDAEKAYALWWQEVTHRYHFGGGNGELTDPVKVLNVYGYNTCGHDSMCLAGLWHAAGLRVAPARAVGHCIAQAFYDGAWHMLDGDMHSVYLLRDNKTVAGEQDIVRDHDLVKRTHNYGILQPDNRASDENEAALYVYEGPVVGDRNSPQGTTMNMVLRPGESLTYRWGHTDPLKVCGPDRILYPETICNGLWEYRPGFSKDLWRRGADSVENIAQDGGALAAEAGKTGTIVWTMRSPYVFVGGRLEVDGAGAGFAVSRDGKEWKTAGADLDAVFAPDTKPCYSYKLRCSLSGAARLRGLVVVNDLQMAPRAMPEMGIGQNAFTYTDQSPAGRAMRITQVWVERSSFRPPLAPSAAVYPADGGESNGTDVAFRWQPATDPDGDAIVDYEFELSAYPDMRWPLSMDFRKLISRTADKGKGAYKLSAPGLLNPGTKYYWRVKAKDKRGVWGAWSATWSFTPTGPTYPLDVRAELDDASGVVTLHWKPNPAGSSPVAYRVYGSDVKGFSVSDAPYAVNVGASRDLSSPMPANFIAETKDSELVVLGTGVDLPGANKAFYRVVAVDAEGRRSGPSDYAEAPRPVVYSRSVVTAKVGQPYRCEVRVDRSLGDLRARMSGGGQTNSFYDIEQPSFALKQAPDWLSIDSKTGALSGTPSAAGRAEVVVSVTLTRPKRVLDEPTLAWGNEKVLSSGTETVGIAEKKFAIEVAP